MRAVASAWALSSAWLVACGANAISVPDKSTDPDHGSSTTPGSTNDPGSGRSPFQQLAVAECEFRTRCFPLATRGIASNIDDCALIYDGFFAKIRAGEGVNITDEQALACASKRQSANCDDSLRDIPECTFKGPRAKGAPCRFNQQCDTGSCNWSNDCGICGDYVPPPRPKENEPCAAGDVCAMGFVCHKQNKTCVRPTQKGEACDQVSCDQQNQLVCEANAEGTGVFCVDWPFANLNSPCAAVPGHRTWVFCEASTCSTQSVSSQGTCVPYVKEGSSCTADGPRCEMNTSCVDGICKGQAGPTCK